MGDLCSDCGSQEHDGCAHLRSVGKDDLVVPHDHGLLRRMAAAIQAAYDENHDDVPGYTYAVLEEVESWLEEQARLRSVDVPNGFVWKSEVRYGFDYLASIIRCELANLPADQRRYVRFISHPDGSYAIAFDPAVPPSDSMGDHEHNDECRDFGCVEYSARLMHEAGQRRAKERAEKVRSLRIEELIDQSSLGTPEALAIRAQTPPEVVERIMRKVEERSADNTSTSEAGR